MNRSTFGVLNRWIIAGLLLAIGASPALGECEPSAAAAARQAYDTAYAFVQQGKWNTAIRSLKKAQQACPEHWPSKELLAQAYLRTRKYDEAVSEYESLIEGKYHGDIDSTETRVLNGYGFALLKAKQVAKAEPIYLKYHEKEPDNPEPMKRLVYVYEVTKRYDEAIKYEKLLYQMNPNEHEYSKKIGDLYKRKGDAASAQQWYKKAADAGIVTTGAFDLGLQHMKAGRYQQAAAAFEDYLEGKPRSAPAWQNLGYCYSKLGKTEKAISAYEKALELDSNRHGVASSLGFLYLDAGRVSDAARIAGEAIANWPEDDSKKPGIYYLMGQVLEKQGEYRKAIDMFDKIVEDPQWGDRAAQQIERQRQLIAIQKARKEKNGG